MNIVGIYTKVCLPCVMKKEWDKTQRAIWNAGYETHIIRTTYDAQAHKEATLLWGSDNYVAFVLMPNGEVVTLGKARKMFEEIKDKMVGKMVEEIKDKMVKAGKTKPVRKDKKNVQGLRKTKRSVGVDAVEDSPVEIKVQTKA